MFSISTAMVTQQYPLEKSLLGFVDKMVVKIMVRMVRKSSCFLVQCLESVHCPTVCEDDSMSSTRHCEFTC